MAVEAVKRIRSIEEKAQKIIEEAEVKIVEIRKRSEAEAEKVRVALVEEARQRSEATFKDAEAKINLKVKEVLTEAKGTIAALSEKSSKNMDKAVKRVVSAVLGVAI